MTEGYEKLINKLKPEKLEAERSRLAAMKSHEEASAASGFDFVLGVDEVGRGPLCGPVVTACCVLDPGYELLFLNDSKKLSEKKREILSTEIMEHAVCYAYGEGSPELIDKINILNATKTAMKEAINACANELFRRYGKDLRLKVLIDGNQKIPDLPYEQETIVKGDSSSVSIAAASILAKVKRDHMMEAYEDEYPGYGLAKNKGYGTREHLEGLEKLGPTPIHRLTFVPKSKAAIGLHYEKVAAKLLMLNGYEILCENYRSKEGEIDIVACKDGILCFVEVKYRSKDAYGYPSEAVDRKKQERIYKTALIYLSDPDSVKTDKNGRRPDQYRFDVVEIQGERYRILPDAFRRPSGLHRNYFT